MTKAVVFDAYGTLFDVNSVRLQCESMYPGQGDSITQIWRQKQLEYSWQRAMMHHYEDFWTITGDGLRYALDKLQLQYTEATVNKLRDTYLELEPYPEVSAALRSLQAHRLLILSNGTQAMLQTLVENTGLTAINDILSADDLQTYKPRREVYELALSFLGIRKEHILFVSSNAWDAAGAKWFGFTVGWVNRANSPLDRLGVTPDYIVSNLMELAEIVR